MGRPRDRQGLWRAFVDGAARGNPGPAGAGVVVIAPDGTVRREIAHYLGERTNNQAEYEALLLALEALRGEGAARAEVVTDSELLARQLRGEYRVRSAGLLPLFQRAVRLLDEIGEVSFREIPRSENRRADRLANFAIDSKRGVTEGASSAQGERGDRPGEIPGEESPSSAGQGAG